MMENNNVFVFPGVKAEPFSSVQDVSRAIGELCRNIVRLTEESLDASAAERQTLESLIDIQLNTIATYIDCLKSVDDTSSDDASAAAATASPG